MRIEDRSSDSMTHLKHIWIFKSFNDLFYTKSGEKGAYLRCEIPQYQPAAGPVGAVGAPGGSLC